MTRTKKTQATKAKAVPKVTTVVVPTPSAPKPKVKATKATPVPSIRREIIASARSARVVERLDEEASSFISIQVRISACAVFQYFFGYFASVLSSDSRPGSVIDAAKLAYTCMSKLPTPFSTGLELLPEIFVELGLSLQTCCSGVYCFTADWSDWSSLSTLLSGMQIPFGSELSGAFGADGWPTAATYVTGSDSFLLLLDKDFEALLARFSKRLSLCNPISSTSRFRPSPSAFATGMTAETATLTMPTVLSDTPYYLNSNTGYVPARDAAGLEVKIDKPHLARLRLARRQNAVAGVTPTERNLSHFIGVTGTPSAYGYCVANGFKSKEPRFATISASRVISAMTGVIFAAVNAFGANNTANSGPNPNNLNSAVSALDVRALTWWLLMWFHTRYMGSNLGVCIARSAAAGQMFETFPTTCASIGPLLENLPVPKRIMELLGAMDLFVYGDEVILPLLYTYLPVSPNGGVTDVVSVQYWATGSLTAFPTNAAYVAASTTVKLGMLSFSNKAMAIITNWKVYARALASVVTLSTPRQQSVSCLDAALALASTSDDTSYVYGLVSGRRLTAEREAYLIRNAPAVSIIAVTFSGNNNSYTLGSELARSGVRCRFMKVYPYSEQYIDYVRLGVLDGLTNPGTEQSNLQNMFNPDVAGVMHDHEVAPLQAPSTSLSYNLGRLIGKIKGNYCGAGWTAGSYEPKDWTVDSDGKYLVPATDAEDAACKHHDELYLKASKIGNAAAREAAITSADNLLADTFREIREKGQHSNLNRVVEVSMRHSEPKKEL